MKLLEKTLIKYQAITMMNLLEIHIIHKMKVQIAFIISKIWINVSTKWKTVKKDHK